MKKIAHIILLAGLASVLAVHAQTNSVPQDQPATTSTDTAGQAAARAALQQKLNGTSTDTDSNAVTVATTNSVTVVTTTTNSQTTVTTNEAPASTTTTEMTAVTTTNEVPAAAAAVEAAPAPPGIPLIQFSDVPLTTAIENLARQANINYMLDPKIAYGQPDQNGQIKAEPTLSIRWENISAQSALLALLDNYGLELIRDQHTGIARITVKDPSAPPPLFTRVLQLKYASVSNMVTAVESTLTDKRSKVLADNRTSQLVIVATDPEQQAVDILIGQLDKPTKQVLIETKLVDISSNPTSQKGIDWSGTLQAQHVAFGNSSTFIVQPTAATPGTATTVNGVTTISGAQPAQPGLVSGVLANPAVIASTVGGFGPEGFLNADGLSAVISFLNSSADAQIVSTPRVVTLDNEMATIAVTRGYPVFNVTAGTANTTGGSSVGYTNVGTTLKVTPRISANEQIWLKVCPEVSSFAGVDTQTVGGQTYQADLFDFRYFDTQVLIPNAHTLVMGGLVQDNPISSSTKVPLLGDIPGLGYAFRSETKSVNKDNLLIFITPTIVKDEDFRSSDTQFFKSLPTKRPVQLDPNNLWDGTRPYNWSNPTNTDPAQAILNESSVQ
ncbi:MAG: secretin N-terminal domain-containing protein [Verrucomicrobiota bacterium]|jgi:type II secretory pathway component GspD/PulD (secretin)